MSPNFSCYSIQTAFVKVTNDFHITKCNGQLVILIFLDLRAVFDRTDHFSMKHLISPGWCGSVDWVVAENQKIIGSIPSQGTCLGCETVRGVWEATKKETLNSFGFQDLSFFWFSSCLTGCCFSDAADSSSYPRLYFLLTYFKVNSQTSRHFISVCISKQEHILTKPSYYVTPNKIN